MALFVAVLLLGVACGGDDDEASSESNGGGSQPSAVTIMDFKFNPASITVKAGDPITFNNQDAQAHTATADTAGTFDTMSIDAGGSAEATLEEPGSYPYHCSFHPFMKATITVE
ncbi:MAG: cupredoxin domain-containing protein [Acidimicrobiia bacterium]